MGIAARIRRLKNDLDVEQRTYAPLAMTPITTALRAAELLPDEPSREQLLQIAAKLNEADRWVGRYLDELISFSDLLRTVTLDIEAQASEAGDQVHAPAPEWSVQINGLDEEAIDRIARFYRDSGTDIR